MNSILLIGFSQAVFLSIFLLTKKENKLANKLLALLLSLISISLLLNYSYSSGLILQFPHLIGLDTAFPFLYGPILYFYTKVLVSGNQRFHWNNLLHLIPFIIYFLYVFFNFYIKEGHYKIDFLNDMLNFKVPNDILFFNFLKIIQAFIYLFLTLKLIEGFRQTIELNFSSKHRINLNWLKMLNYGLIGIYFIKLIGIIVPLLTEMLNPGEMEGLTDLFVILFVYLIAFGAIRQPSIFEEWQPLEIVQKKIPEKTAKLTPNNGDKHSQKYVGSPLVENESQKILTDLLKLMDEEKVYLKNSLTIKELADILEVKSKYLSQVINEQLNQNFFNFINGYRVEEVKKRLQNENYKHLSILGIASECGFNSKSSFNSIFKQKTGLTPTQYISSISVE